MVGPGLAIDGERYFVICVNSLGSCFGSTGPASVDPATGQPYRLTFPDLSVEDIARAGFETVRSLGIERLHCHGPLARGHGGACVCRAVPRRGAAAGVYLGDRGGGALRDRAALHPTRGDHP